MGTTDSESARGALLHIDKGKVLAALRLVRSGEIISLNRPMDALPPPRRPPLKRSSLLHNQIRPLGPGRFAVVNDDFVEFALQGSSHWDSFAHYGTIEPGKAGVFYGGIGLEETWPEPRARRLGIGALGPAIVTHGVLLDAIAVLMGGDAPFLDEDAVITRDVVLQCLSRQRLKINRGDAVLVHTGFEKRLNEMDTWPEKIPGLDGTTVPLWREWQVSALASDNPGVEATPQTEYPIHVEALRHSGIPLGELWALEELLQACRGDGVFEFLLVSVPLNIPGAFGTPANAIAIR